MTHSIPAESGSPMILNGDSRAQNKRLPHPQDPLINEVEQRTLAAEVDPHSPVGALTGHDASVITEEVGNHDLWELQEEPGELFHETADLAQSGAPSSGVVDRSTSALDSLGMLSGDEVRVFEKAFLEGASRAIEKFKNDAISQISFQQKCFGFLKTTGSLHRSDAEAVAAKFQEQHSSIFEGQVQDKKVYVNESRIEVEGAASREEAMAVVQQFSASPSIKPHQRRQLEELFSQGAVHLVSKQQAAASKNRALQAFRQFTTAFSTHVTALIAQRREVDQKRRSQRSEGRTTVDPSQRKPLHRGHELPTARRTATVFTHMQESSQKKTKDLHAMDVHKEVQFQRDIVLKTKKNLKTKASIANEEVAKIEEKKLDRKERTERGG